MTDGWAAAAGCGQASGPMNDALPPTLALWHDHAVSEPLLLQADGARLSVCPADGGRIASLIVGGDELLVTDGPGAIWWGTFPMAPFAGRVRHGSFSVNGHAVQLPRNMPPHAIHGLVFDRAWRVDGPDTISIDLGPAWPFEGRVTQRFELRPTDLTVSMTLDATEPMPAELGWHPWFRRELVGSPGEKRPPSALVDLAFEPGLMYERDSEDVPTGALSEPTPPPWDDCFTDVRVAPRLIWPERLELELTSSCDHWLVYTEPAHAICVEPQTGPPDAFNLRPRVVEPGHPLTATMRWSWRQLG